MPYSCMSEASSNENRSDRRGRPLRRDRVGYFGACTDGRIFDEPLEGSRVSYSPDGSIDSARVFRILHCGHPSTVGLGGVCREEGCANNCCQICATEGMCTRCLKFLCMEHRYSLDEGTGVLCRRCYDEVRWGLGLRRIGRVFLSPFISFPEEDEE